MKKRLSTFFIVIVFVLSFPVVASANAATVIVSVLLEKTIGAIVDKTVENLEDGNYLALVGFYNNQVSKHWNEMSEQEKSDLIHSYYQHMQNTGEFDPSTISTGWASNLKPIEFYLLMAARAYGAPTPTTGDYHYMIWAVTMQSYYQINVRIIYDTSHTNDFNYFLNYYNEPCVERANYRPVSCVYACIVDDTMFGGTNCSIANGMYDPSRQGCYTGQNMSASDVYCYSTDMVDAPLTFSAHFSVSGNNLSISLDSNRPVTDDLKAVAGILYDDGTHTYDGTDRGYINADYLAGQSLLGSQHWEWSFDLGDFTNWAYRKRIFDCNNFYAFVHVLDSGTVKFADQSHLDLSDPTGIFEDVQPMPDPDDYKPTPTTYPTFPDVSFDYSPTNNYTTYNYDTVNNYDSTTQNFNDWLGDTITTINNNIAGGLDNVDKNIKVTGDNIKNFTEEFKNYVEGSSADISEYLGDLIKKFNDDFNNWTDSFSRYLGDLFQTLNDNITIIGDNIVNAIKLQAIPDKENVIDICKTNFPLYNDFSNLFSEHDVSNSDLIVAIPYLSNDNANGIELVTRDLNAAAADEPEEISRELNSDYDPVMTPYLEGYYVFNISALLRSDQYQFSRFRTVATIIILGATFFALFNITLKCFGMHFGALSASDSKDDS